MGTDARAKSMARELGVEDERQLKALEENDTALYFTVALYNVFSKCGNCGWRMKCANGLMDRMLAKRVEDLDTEALVNGMMKVFDFLKERLGDEDFHTMIKIILTEMNWTIEELLENLEKMFGKCVEYGFIPGVQSGGG